MFSFSSAAVFCDLVVGLVLLSVVGELLVFSKMCEACGRMRVMLVRAEARFVLRKSEASTGKPPF